MKINHFNNIIIQWNKSVYVHENLLKRGHRLRSRLLTWRIRLIFLIWLIVNKSINTLLISRLPNRGPASYLYHGPASYLAWSWKYTGYGRREQVPAMDASIFTPVVRRIEDLCVCITVHILRMIIHIGVVCSYKWV